jgi:hypothetical protein
MISPDELMIAPVAPVRHSPVIREDVMFSPSQQGPMTSDFPREEVSDH